MVELKRREEISEQFKWDTYSVFPSNEAWEEAVLQLKAEIGSIAAYSGRLSQGAQVLSEALEAVMNLYRNMGKIIIYASNFHNVDTADGEAAGRDSRSMALYAQVAAATAFLEPELIAIGFDTLRQWLDEEPGLAVYSHFVDDLERKQAHVRTPEIEELLGMVREPFETASSIHGILADADLVFEPAIDSTGKSHEVAQGTIDALLMSEDRELRRTAWQSYSDAHLAHQHSMAACLSGGVKQDVFMARARLFDSAVEAALDANNIPVAVYYNVVDTFKANLPLWHRYWRLLRKALGYEKLHVYDIKAPLSADKPVVSFDQAATWVSAALAPLGENYVGTLCKGLLEQRWVDVMPNKNKRAGAYSYGMPGTFPFVLMSFTDDLESVSTLAHELGHSMHSYHTWETQPQVYSDYSIFVAEVPSNFNQAVVRDYLFEHHPERDFQIALIEEAMSNFHRYFFLMPTLARFELEIHERVERGEALTADSMNDLLASLFAEGYGGEVEMDHDRIGVTWAEFPTHLYSNFYVYQYTTGIAGAHALANRVLDGGAAELQDYIDFISAGSAMYPLDALKHAGVDMTSPAPIQAAFDYLGGLIDRLEELIERGD